MKRTRNYILLVDYNTPPFLLEKARHATAPLDNFKS